MSSGFYTDGKARDAVRLLSSQLATDLKKRYDGGASIRSLAESTGRSYGFVHRILSESGTAMRNRGGRTAQGGTKSKSK